MLTDTHIWHDSIQLPRIFHRCFFFPIPVPLSLAFSLTTQYKAVFYTLYVPKTRYVTCSILNRFTFFVLCGSVALILDFLRLFFLILFDIMTIFFSVISIFSSFELFHTNIWVKEEKQRKKEREGGKKKKKYARLCVIVNKLGIENSII